ncbi:hypothetical protein [Paraburkholderia aromaticivorans]|uniref:Uncharacterized protein n=1 Tax=Paraburkholderia aromaticivorans TaxID=2026199 RepID=A0A248VTD2_9BURK|nr:hypothetical protein [Paraburkholderia aromaticivorans]ASW02288.1 hypothetical protein CJU94_29735 [Paraburkholderia aromaticivorans]
MLDAVELARLPAAGSSWDDAAAEYETSTSALLAESAYGSAEGDATFLSHGGQALTLEVYRQHAADEASAGVGRRRTAFVIP